MNIALFADDEVGLETARVFQQQGRVPSCLVLDARDRKGLNNLIVEAAGVPSGRVVLAQELDSLTCMEWLRTQQIDLGVLAWWPFIIKPTLLSIPSIGFLNFHPSLLPHNRGKDPNFWTLKDQTPAGVSIHFVDEGIDTGDVAFQALLETSWEDTGESLYARSKQSLVQLFRENLPRICAGDIPRVPQSNIEGSFHKRQEIDPASRLDLDASYRGRDLLNLLRARTFAPHPGAWFVDREQRYEVRVTISKASRT